MATVEEELARYVLTLETSNPRRVVPESFIRSPLIQINLTDHWAFVDDGKVSVGARGDLAIPADVLNTAYESHLPFGERSISARRLMAVDKARICRNLVVFSRTAGVVSATVYYWNGRTGDDLAVWST